MLFEDSNRVTLSRWNTEDVPIAQLRQSLLLQEAIIDLLLPFECKSKDEVRSEYFYSSPCVRAIITALLISLRVERVRPVS